MSTSRIEQRKEAVIDFFKLHPVEPSSKCYDMLERKFPELSRATHRNFVYQMEEDGLIVRPENKEFCCPQCHVVAIGIKEGQEIFGFRHMHDNVKRIQSWCRECRILDSRKRYLESKLKKRRFSLSEEEKEEIKAELEQVNEKIESAAKAALSN